MGRIIAAGLCLLVVGLALAQTGQPPRTLPQDILNPPGGQIPPNPIQPVSGTRPDPALTGKTPARIALLPTAKLNDLQKQMLNSTQRATVWLTRMHGANGRFVPGWRPDLKTEMEGDSYLRQAGAALALARAARFSGEAELNARATQTLLSLLDETVVDEKSGARYTSLPSAAVNRLGAAGLLVAAINELPEPKADLLARSEQLCAYLRTQACPEGWLSFTDTPPEGPPGNSEALQTYPGQALYGLQLSQRHKPAPWKADLLKKAVAFYHPWWRTNRSPEFVPWQAAAYAEAYLATRDPAFGNCTLEMADWLTTLQYTKIDQRSQQWYGGFMGFAEGKSVEVAPQANAARVARLAGDVTRERNYVETLDRAIQFLMTLQYTDSNAQHFADWYRPRVVGGFHASMQDGALRLDSTQHGLTALIATLDHVVIPGVR
jgi:hypothetical protein